jgi:hypothetical protein
VRRAFIGFSSPIGYDSRFIASQTRNDGDSRPPNARIFGSTGILLLYDEIYFACESLCPENMRGLPYVRFLDQHSAKMSLIAQNFQSEINAIYQQFQDDRQFQNAGRSSDYHREFCSEIYQHTFDDHRNGVAFLDGNIFPKCGVLQSIIDQWLISRFQELQFATIINPFTVKSYFSRSGDSGATVETTLKRLETSEKLISLQNSADIATLEGPYHPIIEELREDPLIENYRNWLAESTGTWHNREVTEIVDEVDKKIAEFTLTALAQYVEPTSLIRTVVSVTKGLALDSLPGASTIVSLSEQAKHYHKRQEFGWQAFIARSRYQV